jgi:geranylgeranylglycerol-phosphate geranylgeranyltransferase
LITGISVFVGGVIAGSTWYNTVSELVTAAVSAGLIAAGGNAYNDYCDRDLDRIQKPERPIPSGSVSASQALTVALFCFFIGWIASWLLNITAVVIASAAIILLLNYSRFWKQKPLIGNVVVAFVAGLAFIYGGIAVNSFGSAFWAAWLAFLFHLGREIIKDLEDLEGDAQAGAETLVVSYGSAAGRIAATCSFALLVVSLPIPYLYGPYRQGYLILALSAVLPMLVFAVVETWRADQRKRYHRLSILLKADMIAGLLALYIGRPLSG